MTSTREIARARTVTVRVAVALLFVVALGVAGCTCEPECFPCDLSGADAGTDAR